jgi:hypothetical protein
MSAHTTISASTTRLVAERAGVTVHDVRRALVGLPVADATKIHRELQAAGVDTTFLRQLSTAAKPLSDYVPRTPTDNSR